MKKTIIAISILGLVSFAFYEYGRRIWHPVYLKYTGKKTMADVYKKYGQDAENQLSNYFKSAGIKYPPEKLTLVGLKKERKLEVWANKSTLIHIYDFTGFSGRLGPKLVEGDRQIPEGIYGIEYMNPNSSYHLSMKVNYPNSFDKKVAKEDGRTRLGGDIFIHGKSSTIGCIPIGDDNIEELFTLVYKVGRQNVRVIIAPYDFRNQQPDTSITNLKWLGEKYQRIKSELLSLRKS